MTRPTGCNTLRTLGARHGDVFRAEEHQAPYVEQGLFGVMAHPGGIAATIRTQYDAPVVIPSRLENPRRSLFVACAVLTLGAVALAWYATQTVRPDCVVGVSTITGRDGRSLPDANGRTWSDLELIDRAYRRAIASGHCDPPSTRWKRWLD